MNIKIELKIKALITSDKWHFWCVKFNINYFQLLCFFFCLKETTAICWHARKSSGAKWPQFSLQIYRKPYTILGAFKYYGLWKYCGLLKNITQEIILLFSQFQNDLNLLYCRHKTNKTMASDLPGENQQLSGETTSIIK